MLKTSDQLQLIPPYCPNNRCPFHLGTNSRFYVKNGFATTEKFPHRNQRYKCKTCLTQFSENSFSLEFRRRKEGLFENTLQFSMNGMSNNSIARLFNVSEGTVRDRLKVLAKQSLYFEKENYPKKIKEDIAYDGFESFTYSQYSPCYINTAVGSRSMFVYHNTFSPLNRKGRMTEEQKTKNLELIRTHGLYPKDSVFEETLYVLKNISSLGAGRTLYSDEHKSYVRAIKSFDFKLRHHAISSERRRDPSNPLFPINHLHMLYRHFLSSQKRETISFQKHEAALLEKIQIMKVYRNFMNTKFVKKNKFDPHAHEWSPAMYVGVAEKVYSFKEVFGIRKLSTQVRLDLKESAFINREYPYSRQTIAA
jgi:transposase-like protein